MSEEKDQKKRTKWLHVKCTPDELAPWKSRAAAAGLTLSDLVRSLLSPSSAPVGRPKRASRKEDPALILAVTRIGINLNQLARWANKSRIGIDQVQMLAALSSIESDVRELLKTRAKP